MEGKIENEKNGCRQGSINVRNEKQNKMDGIILMIHPIKGKWSNVGLFAHAALQSVPSIVGYAGAAAAKLSAYIIAALQNVQLFAY